MKKALLVIAAFIGSYVFTWGFISISITSLVYFGIDFHSAEASIFMLSCLLLVTIFLWFFTINNRWIGWTILYLGGAVMTLAGYFLQTALLA